VKRREANAILIAFAGIGGALAAYSVPISFYEFAFSSSGISEAIPAAAPPLGSTARSLIVIGGAIVSAAIVASILPKGRAGGRGAEKGNIMTFAFSKLVALARGGTKADKTPLNLEDSRPLYEPEPAPAVRRSDAHPDAPPRSPVFASRELGSEALPPVEDISHDEHNVPDHSVESVEGNADLAMPRTPEPLPWAKIEQEMDRLLAGARMPEVREGQGDTEASPLPSIHELADRLESGLAKRRALRNLEPVADHAVASLAEPVSVSEGADDVHHNENEQDNQGLDEALAALRGITARGK